MLEWPELSAWSARDSSKVLTCKQSLCPRANAHGVRMATRLLRLAAVGFVREERRPSPSTRSMEESSQRRLIAKKGMGTTKEWGQKNKQPEV
jgi:hypothetical protein